MTPERRSMIPERRPKLSHTSSNHLIGFQINCRYALCGSRNSVRGFAKTLLAKVLFWQQGALRFEFGNRPQTSPLRNRVTMHANHSIESKALA